MGTSDVKLSGVLHVAIPVRSGAKRFLIPINQTQEEHTFLANCCKKRNHSAKPPEGDISKETNMFHTHKANKCLRRQIIVKICQRMRSTRPPWM